LLQTLTPRSVSGDLLDDYAIATESYSAFNATIPNPSITIQFNSTALGATGWLQQLSVTGTRNLAFTDNNFLRFRDPKSI
ncbi:hypothetical protein ABTD73_21490, partial [Acinetobacter baumannii]